MKPSLLLSPLLLLLTALPTPAACPTYMKKDTVINGSPASLPEGFMLFSIVNKQGIYKSPLRTFDTTVIPGTQSQNVASIDISDDGKWVLYNVCTPGRRGGLAASETRVISIDGGKSAAAPIWENLDFGSSFPGVVGFIHGSPNGMEFFYYESNNAGSRSIRAMKVDVIGDSVGFSGFRTILDLSATTDRLWPFAGANITAVAKDGIFGLMGQEGMGSPSAAYNQYITIPDGGRGTATMADAFKWINPPDTSLWGCGQTMTFDGTLCATNAGYMGDSCVPSHRSSITIGGTEYHTDHKGIYITPFFRKDDAPMAIDDQVLKYGVSINWCPARYRFGTSGEVDFNEWEFSNRNQYLIGRLGGTLAPLYGIFVLQWETNTWTLVTPDSTKTSQYTEPVMYITEPLGVREGARTGQAGSVGGLRSAMKQIGASVISLPKGVRGFEVYSLAGIKVFSAFSDGSKTTSVMLPKHLKQQACVIRFIAK